MLNFKGFAAILSLLFVFINMSCNTRKWSEIDTGISGFVRQAVGNQMPDPNEPRPAPAVFETTVYVYELTPVTKTVRMGTSPIFTKIETKLIDSVDTDKKGYYQFKLPPGNYSVFVKQEGHFFASIFDDKNNANPVKVEQGKVSALDVVVNNKASY
jgi:hypothetical protein